MSPQVTVRDIANHIGGAVVGDPDAIITGIKSLKEAGPGDLVFVDQARYLKELEASRASAAILPEDLEPPGRMSGIKVPQPALGVARALELLFPPERNFVGVSPQAFLGKNVFLGEGVGIGPGAYIGDNVKIGRGTEVHPAATIGRDTVLGEDCIIYSGAHIYHRVTIGSRVIIHSGAVIGADGFGFIKENLAGPEARPEESRRHKKMLQIGRVVIEDDVEIGANTTIDRAALDATFVGRGTKIDDQVMIGHNCRIGRHCILISQVGISGSTEIGDYVTIAGQAGLAGHIKVGPNAMIGAQAGVTKDVAPAHIVLGAPAIDARQARKAYSLIETLPDFKKALADHEKRLASLEAANNGEKELPSP